MLYLIYIKIDISTQSLSLYSLLHKYLSVLQQAESASRPRLASFHLLLALIVACFRAFTRHPFYRMSSRVYISPDSFGLQV